MRIQTYLAATAVATGLVLGVATSASAWADADDDLEGRIESVNQNDPSFVLQGIIFYVTETTDYDDNLKGFSDLRKGQKVEVDFKYRDGKHFATEIELDD